MTSPNDIEIDDDFIDPELSTINNLKQSQSSSPRLEDFEPLVDDYKQEFVQERSALLEESSNHRKRKRQPSTSDIAYSQQKIKLHHNPEAKDRSYRAFIHLLNEQINDAALGVRYEDTYDTLLEDSQIGATFWTGEDKELFFNGLIRFGRDEIVKIANHIGDGKSAAQVKEYLDLLEEGSAELNKNKGELLLDSFPAATEVDAELQKAMGIAVDHISSIALRWEEREEYRKWKDTWLLNDKWAGELKKQYTRERKIGRDLKIKDESEPSNEQHIYKLIPAAELLHLPNFLRLSENIFMNIPRRRLWMESGPAIRHTAFNDFYNLVISITERIISVVIFQTESRLRAWKPPAEAESRGSAARTIYQRDVLVALDMLGIRADFGDYWIKLPRRYGLHCVVTARQKRRPVNIEEGLEEGVVDPDLAEELLRKPPERGMQSYVRAKVQVWSAQQTAARRAARLAARQREAGNVDQMELDDSVTSTESIIRTDDTKTEDESETESGDTDDAGVSEDDKDESSGESASEASSSEESDDGSSEEEEVETTDVSMDAGSATTPVEVRSSSDSTEESDTEESEADDSDSSDAEVDSADESRADASSIDDQAGCETHGNSEEEPDEFTVQELESLYPIMYSNAQLPTEEEYQTQLEQIPVILQMEAIEQDFLEQMDEARDEIERKRLWAIINGDPVPKIEIQEQVEDENHIQPIDREAPPKNWRVYTTYVSEWERQCIADAHPDNEV